MTNNTSRMDYEQSHQESVKCVVVGDTAVGKTRLICAKACNLILDLSQLMTTHIPTVWAIDQYRIKKEVLERSWEVVDGVNVSLRLWDTFGCHDKDRQFAYGRAEVVLLCFSVGQPNSLRNCKDIWYPEIRKFCPNTPIVLVGCKNDLRHMFRDEKFQKICREKSPFFRPLKESDILTPEMGRKIAQEINAVAYYETSVYTGFGIDLSFENVIRAALISRRQQRFWMTNLRHIRPNCEIQEPFCPPKPTLQPCRVPLSSYRLDLSSMYGKQLYTDVEFLGNDSTINCHKIILVVVSDIFYTLFTYQPYTNASPTKQLDSEGIPTKKLSKFPSDISIAKSLSHFEQSSKHKYFNDDSFLDVHKHNLKNFLSASFFYPILSLDTLRFFKHSFSKSNKLFSYTKLNPDSDSKSKLKFLQEKFSTVYKNVKNLRSNAILKSKRHSIISFGQNIPLAALEDYIKVAYMLTSNGDELKTISMSTISNCLDKFDFVEFDSYNSLNLLKTKLETYINEHKLEIFTKRLAIFGLDEGLFSDVMFKLEDGFCVGHKAILMARCEVMEAMFSGDFKESLAQVVVLPGVIRESFQFMLYYIYTDEVHELVSHKNCLPLIELANRFCLPRLIAIVEDRIIKELNQMSEKNIDISMIVLKLLERCQMHNADQLTDYCLYGITTNYNDICHNNTKLLRSLHPENQAYLNRNRWPPIWYLKEYDYFQRCQREREWNENPKSFKRHKLNSGCFCFSSKSKTNRINMMNNSSTQYTGLSYKIISIM